MGERVERYLVPTDHGHTILKLRPSTAARYPGARRLDGSAPPTVQTMARPEPEPPAPVPVPTGALTHLGGGWYLLPDGRRIRGRAQAEDALRDGEES